MVPKGGGEVLGSCWESPRPFPPGETIKGGLLGELLGLVEVCLG